MCGINGIYHFQATADVDQKLVRRMTEVLTHRGPDDEGFYFDDRVGLGHRRLSIIDVAAGHQPLGNETGRIQIVFNGELYNFQELRKNLISQGHRFKTNSDTEVIVHQYEQDGVGCLEKFRGMFAFAIWDADRQQLFAARDRLGQKPFVYAEREGKFYFASELKAILEDRTFPRQLDPRALDHYLTYQYVPAPMTIFRGIYKLQPGHYMLVNRQGIVREEPYWQLSFKDKLQLREEEYCERFRTLLDEATRLRLISEVPLGAFLSGGVDSSAVVASMAKLSAKPVKTFSIGFTEKRYDETAYAAQVAARFGTEHEQLTVKPNAIDILPKLIWHYNEPYADASAIPTYYVAQMTRQHVTVALNGDAGDESFAGYERYLAMKIGQGINVVPRALRKEMFGALAGFLASGADEKKGFFSRTRRFSSMMKEEGVDRYLHLVRFFERAEREKMYRPSLRQSLQSSWAEDYIREKYAATDAPDEVERIMQLDINTYLPEDLLVKVDIATMANSLEARSPLLDHKLVEFAARVPLEYKLRGRTGKYLMKQALRGILPDQILDRSKMGFGVPISEWFRGELSGYLEDHLFAADCASREYFDMDFLRQLSDQHQNRFRDHGYRLWALLNFELWHRQFMP